MDSLGESAEKRLNLRQHIEGKNCEIRANGFTEMAIDAFIPVCNFRIIIAFKIERLRHPEHIAGAEFYTEFATLAPFLENGDLAFGDLDGFQIKRNAPIFHFKNPFARQAEKFLLERKWPPVKDSNPMKNLK
jgi:hypothetical protein